MPPSLRLNDAALAGVASAMRSSVGPATLAARGRVSGRLRTALILAGAGELIADKLPMTPSRTLPPSIAARSAAGACTGYVITGPPGALVGAATAFAATVATYHARRLIGQLSGRPDWMVALGEDLVAITLAGVATRPAPAQR